MNTLIAIMMMLLTYVIIGAAWSLTTLVAFLITGWVQRARTPNIQDWDKFEDDYATIPWAICMALPWLWPFWLYTGIRWMWDEHKSDV